MTNLISHNHGSHFADESEIIRTAEKILCDGDEANAGGVPVLSDGKTMHVINQTMHSLIFGSTGSMKTRRIIMPLMASLIMNGESIIINDPKGELYKRFNGLLDKHGYDTGVLNFRDSGKGLRWNPLYIAYNHYRQGNKDNAKECLRDVGEIIYNRIQEKTTDVFWGDIAVDYFVGLGLLLLDEVGESGFTIENLVLAHIYGQEKISTSSNARIINEYCKGLDRHCDALMHLISTLEAPTDTRASVHSVFLQPLSLYLQENLRDMFCESDIDFSKIGKEKTAIFLITPDERSAYNPIIACFIKQCYQCLVDMAHSSECGGSLPIRVNIVADEFSNMPAIPDFNSMISAARARNIRFHLVVQNLAQLYKAYSQEIAETIMTNASVWHILRSKDHRLHELIQKLCGDYISEYCHTARPLIDNMMIQRLDKERGEVLILIDGQFPFVTELPDIDEYAFKMPKNSGSTFVVRQPKERAIFDIREGLLQQKQAERCNNTINAIKQYMEAQQKTTFTESPDLPEWSAPFIEKLDEKKSVIRANRSKTLNEHPHEFDGTIISSDWLAAEYEEQEEAISDFAELLMEVEDLMAEIEEIESALETTGESDEGTH